MLKLKRIYEPPEKSDGFRVLVDRLWPRGLSKSKAKIDLWLKEIGPSNELRKWFAHDPKRWSEFQKKYRQELKNNYSLTQLKQLVRKHKSITLLYSAKDTEYNQAVALKQILK